MRIRRFVVNIFIATFVAGLLCVAFVAHVALVDGNIIDKVIHQSATSQPTK